MNKWRYIKYRLKGNFHHTACRIANMNPEQYERQKKYDKLDKELDRIEKKYNRNDITWEESLNLTREIFNKIDDLEREEHDNL